MKAREAGWPSSEGVGEERQEGALESFVSGPECAAVFFLYSEMVVFMFVWLSVCMCVGVGGLGFFHVKYCLILSEPLKAK